MTSIYLAPYHSQPGLHSNGSAGQFAVVEKAIHAREWPYDNGDDPSFYVARKGGPLTWGVCRQDVRNAITIGSIVVFFSFTSESHEICYRLSAIATVADKLDRRAVYSDGRFAERRHTYLNVLIKAGTCGWQYDESDRERRAQHYPDWLWRISVHGKNKEPFQSRNQKIYETSQFNDGDVELANNYILFSAAEDETYISPDPPVVAVAVKGRREKWHEDELRRLTLGKAGTNNGRDYLRTDNPTGRNVHPEVRFNLPSEEASTWRQSLISLLRERGSRVA